MAQIWWRRENCSMKLSANRKSGSSTSGAHVTNMAAILGPSTSGADVTKMAAILGPSTSGADVTKMAAIFRPSANRGDHYITTDSGVASSNRPTDNFKKFQKTKSDIQNMTNPSAIPASIVDNTTKRDVIITDGGVTRDCLTREQSARSSLVPSDTYSMEGLRAVAGHQSYHDEDHPSCVAAAVCNIVPETRFPQVNYSDKGTSTVTIPVSGATDDNRLRYPTGVAYCSHTNTILVADWGNRRIMRYDQNGRNGNHFVRPGVKGCDEYRPWDVTTSLSGRVFVTDSLNQRVLVFTRVGKYVTSFGSRGIAKGQFSDVRGITCHNGFVFVCDRGNRRVAILTEDGVYTRQIVTGLYKPRYVTVGPHHTIYVTNYDIINHQYHSNVHVFRWNGSLVRRFGDLEGAGCTWPGGITVDQQGYVCVAWCGHDRVDVYDPKGDLYTTFGKKRGGPDVLWRRQGLALLPDGRLVVCDSNNNRLQIF